MAVSGTAVFRTSTLAVFEEVVCEGGLDLTRIFLYVVSSFRSPESVEMDEIMAAMVLTSLSCSPVVQSSPQTDPGPGL